jgi:hypothetical protein
VHGEKRRHEREAAADDDGSHVALPCAVPRHCRSEHGRRERADADAVEVHPHRRHHVVLAEEDERGHGQAAAHDHDRHDQAEGSPHPVRIGCCEQLLDDVS